MQLKCCLDSVLLEGEPKRSLQKTTLYGFNAKNESMILVLHKIKVE